jgi:Xaa-Pro dipeptidase
MRQAAVACAASLRAAIDTAAAARMENDVAAAMHKTLIEAGSDYLGHPPLVSTGPAAGPSFTTSGSNRIAENDVLFLEAGGTHWRYSVAQSRTVLVGDPDPKWVHMARTSAEALALAIEAV